MNKNGFTDPEEIESAEVVSSVRKIVSHVNSNRVVHQIPKRL